MTDTQCDEQKPICSRCTKGSRDCRYPEPKERPRPTLDAESRSESDETDDEKALIKGSSRSTSPIVFQLNQQMLMESLATLSDVSDQQFGLPNPIVTFSISGLSPAGYCQELQMTRMMPNTRPDAIQFYLDYHRKHVTEYHYFCYHDYRKFFTTELVVMAEHSGVLRIALVAFSSLIYSMKDRSVREQAFLYYALALRQLRELLNTAMDVTEYHLAIATALQLATFDVHSQKGQSGFLEMHRNVFDIYRGRQIS